MPTTGKRRRGLTKPSRVIAKKIDQKLLRSGSAHGVSRSTVRLVDFYDAWDWGGFWGDWERTEESRTGEKPVVTNMTQPIFISEKKSFHLGNSRGVKKKAPLSVNFCSCCMRSRLERRLLRMLNTAPRQACLVVKTS